MKFGFLNKNTKTIALVLAAMIVGGSVSVLSYAAVANKNDKANTAESKQTEASQTSDAKLAKDETVYVLANADGSVKKIIVSDWIKNNTKSATVKDGGELDDVKNVKGNESYTMNADNMREWNADGNDVYLQGTTEKQLPVDLSVTYKLDGKTVSPSELAGKSGKVSIRFDYKNNQYENVNINGKTEKIYVPFIMLTGTILDGDKFSNVDVTNGKILGDGDHIAVAGFALPGMQDNLAIDKEKLELPDYVEITADVKDFELSTTMTLAVNVPTEELSLDGVDSLDGLKAQTAKLNDAMTQLIDGSSQLYGGLTTLLGKSEELVAGIDKIADYASQLNEAAQAIDSGIKTQLVTNNDSLKGGAAKVFSTLLNTVQTTLESQTGTTVAVLTGGKYTELTVANYEDALAEIKTSAPFAAIGKASLEAQLKEDGVPTEYVDAAVQLIYDGYAATGNFDSALASMQNDMKALATMGELQGVSVDRTKVPTIMGMLPNADQNKAGAVYKILSYKAFMAGVSVDNYIANNDAVNQAAAVYDSYVKVATAKANPAPAKLQAVYAVTAGQAKSKITAGVDTALQQLTGTKENPGFKYLYDGINAYTDGVAQLSSKVSLYAGSMKEFNNGAGELSSKAAALPDGVKQLQDGSMRLSSGIKQLNDEGIQKLVSAVDGDLGGLVARMKAVVDVSKDYKSFTGLADGYDGNVKFIYKTDGIEK